MGTQERVLINAVTARIPFNLPTQLQENDILTFVSNGSTTQTKMVVRQIDQWPWGVGVQRILLRTY